ncbi:hypothetical protein M501DRAFT_1015658 [Patellaria atrata CBS 101060]|uniref:Uncharacterized protein n=1 Tax=Patellaria atrata CBS 101060 TaxID=1346257 RepID=A0A9P4VQ84_9PEZI|nr:hypothetical protein M501DRAFT_1015658 [Patellaria atrata CBS 101060]
MTTSLTILPPSPMHSQSPLSRPQPPTSKRPKLSLNTSTPVTQSRSFGKGSSLRLETLSAVSPTARNTFRNAYEKLQGTTASSEKRPVLSIDSSVATQTFLKEPSQSENSSPSSAIILSSASATSASSTESATITIPYKLSHNVQSVLRNSPLPPQRVHSMSGPSRPLFPAAKRVSFRDPLVEEIHTSKYTYAQSEVDLESSTSSIASTKSSSSGASFGSISSEGSSHSVSLSLSTSSGESSGSEHQLGSPASVSSDEGRLGGPRAGDKRDSSDSDSDSAPETPVAGRRKRRREWVWTLGPIGKNASSTSASSTETSTTTSDDESN